MAEATVAAAVSSREEIKRCAFGRGAPPGALFLFLLVDDDVGGTFVHDAGVVGADELAVENLAGGAVDDVAKDLSVAIDNSLLA